MLRYFYFTINFSEGIWIHIFNKDKLLKYPSIGCHLLQISDPFSSLVEKIILLRAAHACFLEISFILFFWNTYLHESESFIKF